MGEESKRLYYENPYLVEFEAKVLKRALVQEKPAVILDQTCFYPESGGQPSDRGTLNDIHVIKLIEEESSILHVLDEDILSGHVRGKIDWERRFDHMQQHGGQHILSQSFSSILKAKTLSFHLGERISTLEIDLRKMTDKNTEDVERLANEIVFQDREIKTYFVEEEDIEKVPLRKPPQKKGKIRVVEISGFDHSACGGTHPRTTGEIGMRKILRQRKIRGNIRMEFVCGSRALQDYSLKDRILRDLSNMLTISEREVAQTCEKLLQDLRVQKKRIKSLTEKVMKNEAQQMVVQAKDRIIQKIFSGKTVEEVRFLALNIIRSGDYVALFGLHTDKRVHLVLACAEGLGVDMRGLVPLTTPLLQGKGGGSSTLVEIVGEKKENLTAALEKAAEQIRKKIE
jgi:alanyl-tRNA synthetase